MRRSGGATRPPTPPDLAPQVVDFVNSSDGWVAWPDGIEDSADGGASWHVELADAGRTWMRVALPSGCGSGGQGGSGGLCFTSKEVGWLVGGSRNPSDHHVLVATSNGGATWTEQLASPIVPGVVTYLPGSSRPRPSLAITAGTIACSTSGPATAWFLADGIPAMPGLPYAVYVTTNAGERWRPVVDGGLRPVFGNEPAPPGVGVGPGG